MKTKKLKLIKELENMGCKIVFECIISNKHLDSFWYEEEVLVFKYRGFDFYVMTYGEIDVRDKNGEMVYDGKVRNNGFKFKLKNDDSLMKIGQNIGDDYYFEHNNWFELYVEKGSRTIDSGQVFHNLNNVKSMLKYYQEEDDLAELVAQTISKRKK